MLRKVLGSVVAFLGAIASAFSAYAFTRAANMADLAEGAGEDRATWILHWQLATGLYTVLGVLLLLGGCLILSRRPIGALVASVAILLAGLSSWAASMVGYSRYAFEAPNVVESTILVGLSGFVFLLYLRRGLWDEPVTPNTSFERTREG